MSGTIGNNNAIGHDGRNAGRKSLKKELIDLQFLVDIWEGKFTQEKLGKFINEKKYGAKHVFAAKCMAGDDRALLKLIDKLFANKQGGEILSPQTEKVGEAVNLLVDLLT